MAYGGVGLGLTSTELSLCLFFSLFLSLVPPGGIPASSEIEGIVMPSIIMTQGKLLYAHEV
jgi:hypothetical protein